MEEIHVEYSDVGGLLIPVKGVHQIALAVSSHRISIIDGHFSYAMSCINNCLDKEIPPVFRLLYLFPPSSRNNFKKYILNNMIDVGINQID